MIALMHAVSSEWLKRRRSLTTWLVWGSAAFVPAIILLARLRRPAALPAVYAARDFWDVLWKQAWESMALMILPFTSMLIVSLIAQIEDRDNAWKQVHAAPVPLPVIFVAKLMVIVALAGIMLVAHTGALYASAVVPAIILPAVSAPSQPFPLLAFMRRNLDFLVDALPIVAIQYALALRFRSFVAPLAIGMALWILSIATLSWTYNYLVPYSYAGLDYLVREYHRVIPLPASPRLIAGASFLVFTMAGYGVYASRRDKG
jgi:hypothetical protein